MPPSRHPRSRAPAFARALIVVCCITPGACGEEVFSPGASWQALTDANPHDGHPAVGLLEIRQPGGHEVDYCTATLVGRATVLTSAHCLARQRQHTLWLAEQAYATEELIVHGGWDASDPAFPNDIGLIQLAEAPGIAVVPLSPAAPAIGLPVTLIGFGSTGDSRTDYGIKRIATNVVDRVDDRRFTFSGSGNGEGSTCEGDSGGPVLATIADREVLIGINSAGVPPCGTKAVTTRVDAYLPWLRRWSDGDLEEATELAPDAACRQLGTCSTEAAGGCGIGSRQPGPRRPPVVLLTMLMIAWCWLSTRQLRHSGR